MTTDGLIDPTSGAPSSSLDPEPKTDENPSQLRQNRDWLLARLPSGTKSWVNWLESTKQSDPRAAKLLRCGDDAWIQFSPSTAQYRVACNSCSHRGCPRCRRRWALKLRDRITKHLDDVSPHRAKFVTLTLKAYRAPLCDQIRHLWNSYRRLRQRCIWKKNVVGSIATLEVTYNATSKLWHPHLHIIADAGYIDQKELSKQWLQATASSMIVDIRKIGNKKAAAEYVTTYVCKSPDFPPAGHDKAMEELWEHYCRSRLYRGHGTMSKAEEEPADDNDYPYDWVPVAPLFQVLQEAAQQDARALMLLAKLRRRKTDANEPTDAHPPRSTLPRMLDPPE